MNSNDKKNNTDNQSDLENLEWPAEADGSAKSNEAGAEDGSGESHQEDLKKELDKAKNDFLYLRAEFDNYRKQVIKERSNLLKYASENLVLDLLNVLDIFDRAVSSEVTAENVDEFKKGLEMTFSEFKTVLERFGVQEIDPEGEAFDPQAHEALGSEVTEDVSPGHISKVYKKAYKLHDKLIRPAQVIVAKEPDNS